MGSIDSSKTTTPTATIVVTPPSKTNEAENPFASPLDHLPPAGGAAAEPEESEDVTTFARSKTITKPPTPQPLDIPMSIHEERNWDMNGSRGKRSAHASEELEESGGRWWTDWLCGCREAPRGVNDSQVCSLFDFLRLFPCILTLFGRVDERTHSNDHFHLTYISSPFYVFAPRFCIPSYIPISVVCFYFCLCRRVIFSFPHFSESYDIPTFTQPSDARCTRGRCPVRYVPTNVYIPVCMV